MERERAKPLIAVAVIIVSLGILVFGLSLTSSEEPQPSGADRPGPSVAPSGAELRDIIASAGGVDALRIADASGAFDLVRFDPLDADALLASNRLSYGVAENHLTNELWTLDGERIRQQLWAPDTPHDFAHFNADGTITRWIHGGGPDFAPRIAQVLDRTGAVVAETTPMYANRFATDDGRVFALLGDGRYGSNTPHLALVVDDGFARRELANGQPIAWIDIPTPGLLVAYPTSRDGSTRVWDTETLEEIIGHALHSRAYVRAAVSADRSTAVGVRFDGELEVIDLRTGDPTHTFGEFDVTGMDQPLALSADGSIVVIVQRTGLVDVWSVDDSTQILQIAGEAAQPRWLSETYAPRSATAISAHAERLAVRNPARPDVSTSWTIVDLGIDWLLARAEGQ